MSTPDQNIVDTAVSAFQSFIDDVLRVVQDIRDGAVNGKTDVSALQPITDAANSAKSQLDAADPGPVPPAPAV